MFRNHFHLNVVLFLSAAVFMFSSLACSGKDRQAASKEQNPPHTKEQKQALEKANNLIEQGYDLKKTGHNRAALNAFEHAEAILSRSIGKESQEVASILDDEATVYLRTGDYEKARTLYAKASDIVAELGLKESRLADGIARRILTLEALKQHGILCNEPLAPLKTADGGIDAKSTPYFPKLEDVHAVFSKINQHLGKCANTPIGSVAIRVVLTGDGRIIAAKTGGNLRDTPPGQCLEDKIMGAAPKYVDSFPKFQACFRNFTFPFVPD